MHKLATKAVAGVRAQPVRLWLALGLILVACWPTLASPFYTQKIIAQTGTGRFTSIDSHCSINEQTNVAFIATDNLGGRGIFFSQGGATPTLVAYGNFLSVWLNNLDQIATVFEATSGGNHVATVRRYVQESGVWTSTTVAKASTAMRTTTYNPCAPFGGYCPFTIRERIEPFDDILTEISMNDAGRVTFTGVLGNQAYLTVQDSYRNDIGPSLTVSSSPQPAWQPVIDNNNHILIRAGNLFTSPILYYPLLFTSAGLESIATELGGFTRIGRSPGVSDDGTVVAFYGELSAAGAQAWTFGNGSAVPIAVTPGPGIFASVKIGNARKLVRLAGVAGNDQLDPGERWLEKPDATGHHDRGQDFNFNQKPDWEIGGFEPDFRIAVSGIKPFVDSSKGSSLTVVFVGTNTNEENIAVQKKALLSARLNIFRDSTGEFQTVGAESPMLVAEENDNPQNAFEAIKKLNITDAVTKEGHVLFWAEGVVNKALVLATRKLNSISDATPGLQTPRVDPDSPIIGYVAASPYNGDRDLGLGGDINQIILHATAGNEHGSLREFFNAASENDEKSIHYLVSRQGRVTQIVQEKMRAHHAGNPGSAPQTPATVENKAKRRASNSHSVGIELVDDCLAPCATCECNKGTGHTRNPQWLTDIQMRSAALLVRDIGVRRSIQLKHLVPIPKDVPGNASNGNRTSPNFVVPLITPQVFEALDGTGDGISDYQPGTRPDPNNGLFITRDGFNYLAKGILSHGQVIDRESGKTDPEIFPWSLFMTMVNHGIGLTLNSPANLLVTDPFGRRTGYDAGSGQTLLEIPGSQFSGAGTEPQSLSIPDATNGNYTIQVVGTSNGVFHLDILASGLDAGLTQTRVAGSTSLGVTTTYTLNHDSVTGGATKVFSTTNLPPVAFDDFAQTTTNQFVVINVLENDSDPDLFLNTNTVTVVTNPSNGTVSVNLTNGLVTYTPSGVFIGTNTFTYTVQDNQGATSSPGVVTVIVTEPVFSTNPPPVAVNDFATTTNGVAISIPVLVNDFTTNGILDPSTVTVTLAPTNGSTSVDSFTGEITYTPNPGTTNRDSFRYTVRDDLGTPSNEGIVTITNIVINGGTVQLQPIPDYLVIPVTSGSVDHRFPRINNLGEVVYQSPVSGLQQVWKKPTGDPLLSSASQITFTNAEFSDAVFPSLADDGSFLCYRQRPNSVLNHEGIIKYGPGPTVIRNSEHRPFPQSETWIGLHPSIASNGKLIYSYNAYPAGVDPGPTTFVLIAGDVSQSSISTSWFDSYLDINANGDFVYDLGAQIFQNNQSLLAGQLPKINDAPRDKPDVVYVNGTNLMSTLFGKLDGGTYASYPINGTWVDVNQDGVLVFEKLVGGYYQVFKAYPWEARIVSRGGTNGLVGLPYKYDGDNVAEAYGGPEPVNDPRGYLPLEWTLVSGPPGFTIDPDTGHIRWIPTAPGNYTAVIRVWTMDPLWLTETEDLETINITVAQSTMQVVDAVDFRTPGTPDLPTVGTNYTTGGTSRIGVLADGASRLVLRVPLVGVETNSFPNLHFAIGGTNVSRDGSLRAITGSAWTNDVPVTIANSNGTNMALCLYESPMDFEVASQPVTIRLYNGTNVIATQAIQLRRPPVVLVHDGWNGPDAWPVLMSELFDAGMDVYFVDYEYAAGSFLSASDTKIFLKCNEAIALARQSGFAASRFDLIGHGSGGILARLHAQRYAAQDTNYRKGDVHKLITIGTPHQGSWLAATVLALRTNNPTLFVSLSNAVLLASEAGGYYPPINLSGGLLDDLAAGSTTLMQLEAMTVPGHAIAATINIVPPGDPISFIQYYLGLPNQGDGLVATNRAIGGIQTNASTVFTNISHAYEPTDTNVVTRVVALLRESLSGSNHFGFFPPADVQTNLPAVVVVTNIGTWLSLSGATNGQTFAPGQIVNVTAVAGGGHVLQSVQFISPVGSALVTTGLLSFNFQIPTQAVGRVVISAAGRDTNNEVAFASVALNVAPAFALQSLVVEPSLFIFKVNADLPLRVLGLYADGIQRDITHGASGTKYKSSSVLSISVNTNGVLHPFVSTLGSPVTISITNGTVWTNVLVTMGLTNLPPAAIITADRITGPAPFDVQFSGASSLDPNGEALSYLWDFGDGTSSSQQVPTVHRFWIPGTHVATLTVTDPFGLVGYDRFVVTVEDRLIVDGVTLTLTNWTAYGEVVVTNGALLIVPNGLSKGNVFVNASTNIFAGSNFLYSLILRSNSVLTVPVLVGLDLTVSNMVVDASSRVDAAGKGYAGGTFGAGVGQGPGGGVGGVGSYFGAGGGYGGLGGNASGTNGLAYGVFANPVDFGSGGGGGYGVNGASGGGLIRLSAQSLRVDGELSANGPPGVNGYAGGGSGGSVNITCHELSGSGRIRANGDAILANGSNSGGGGGRVAVVFDDMSPFTGQIEAKGGIVTTNSYGLNVNGGAGTVYLKKNSDGYGTLIVDNGGTLTTGWSTPVTNTSPIMLQKFSVGGGARVDSTVALQVSGNTMNAGTNTLRVVNGSALGDLTLSSSNQLTLSGSVSFKNLVVSNAAVLSLEGVAVANTLTLRSNAVVTVPVLVGLDLTVSNMVVDASSRVDAGGKGYAGGTYASLGQGPGGGVSDGYYGAGGGYGGTGGNAAGTNGWVYGSVANPVDFGSGGGGGYGVKGASGGGLIRLSAQSLRVDGEFSASGQPGENYGNYFGGGGSGGSVNITCHELSGSGRIRANGNVILSNGSNSGGGGGRVAMMFDEMNPFTGQIEAKGGIITTNGCCVALNGGAGTVYLKRNSDTYGTLIVDNGGTPTSGWSTPLSDLGVLHLNRFTVSGNARFSTPSGFRVLTGNPTNYSGLIASNLLQVGSLVVSNTWVFGDVIDLSASRSNGVVLVSVICRPQKTYLLLATTDFVNWITVATNTPTGSSFSFLDTQSSQFSKRFFRGVMLDYLFDGIGLSVNRTNRQALLTLQGAQPNHTLLLQASEDLRNWITISTTTPAAITNWQFLDTNAPSFNKRFYRAVGQGQ